MLHNSVLLQIHIRVWLNELKEKFAPEKSMFFLDDIPSSVWSSFKDQGFDIIYLLGVWDVDELTEDMFHKKNLQQEFDQVYPGWKWEDTCGSSFSIRKYQINPKLGTDQTLPNLKKTLNELGLQLILDFVPNHFGLTTEYVNIPNLFMEEKNFSESTRDYEVLETTNGKKAIYHGKDPYFPSWEDTLQLDYSSQITKDFMKDQLLTVAGVCNGVRCDMAMLIVNRIILQNWGSKLHEKLITEFWTEAIQEVKAIHPNFTFIAEVYWDMEGELLNLGFDYCYDKKLYDAIRDHNYGSLEYILSRPYPYQEKTARFMENHDEPRAVTVFNQNIYFLAMITTFTLPGLKFFHENQLNGYTKKTSLFLVKRQTEEINLALKQTYINLFSTFFKFMALNPDSQWNVNPSILKNDIERGNNIYYWSWSNSQSKKSLAFIINFKNMGTLIELQENIKEIDLFIDSDKFCKTKLERGKNINFIFELKPFGVLFFSYN